MAHSSTVMTVADFVRVYPVSGYVFFCDTCRWQSMVYSTEDEARGTGTDHIEVVHGLDGSGDED